MTDITAALELARARIETVESIREGTMLRGIHERGDSYRLARALLALAAEREAMRGVVEAAEAWRDDHGEVPQGADHCKRCALFAAVDSLRAALDARKGEP